MDNALTSFIERQIEYARANPAYAELYEHNAYGALMWKIQRTNDQSLMDAWDDRYHPVFEKIIKEYWT